MAARTFADLGVSAPVVDALTTLGFTDAFPIQEAVIGAALGGQDICGKAPTGSGKTLAFGIPAIDLAEMGGPWHPSVLILAPTRELASQIKDELEPIAKARDRSVATVYGGTNIERDIRRLERGVDILVACPGRLEDLIARRCCDLREVRIAIVDEADRMADMGFLPSVKRILDQTPPDRHTMLFSATLDGDVDTLIKRYQQDPLTFEVEEQADQIGDVEHSWYLVEPSERIDAAIAILQTYTSSILFCRTRRGCDRVATTLAKRGLRAVAIHGDRSQSQRERALADFTSGKAQILVATDVAARGIHVDNVALVMHHDPAGSDKDYIHRSGRTGRAGQPGRVISMVVEEKKKVVRHLQRDLGLKPGFDDLDLSTLGPKVERKPSKPKADRRPSPDRSDDDDRPSGRRRDRDDRADRSTRSRDSRGRDRNDRSGRDRGNRNDRSDTRNDRESGRKGGRPNRDDRDGGVRNSRPGANRKGPGASRGRGNRNEWYPPGWQDGDRPKRNSRDDERGPSRSGGRPGRDDDSDVPRSDKPAPGGRNTSKRKNRATKGRHADRPGGKDKGKRRNPRQR